jgi:hypothetical protein
MLQFLKDRPWIWLMALFAAMIAATIVVTVICVRNEPASVPLDTPQTWTDK